MKNELIAGGVGTALSAVGTATQVNETLQTISLVITILGALVSFVVVPLLNWFKEAKKDGKITPDEIAGAAETLEDGINKLNDVIESEETKKKGGKK